MKMSAAAPTSMVALSHNFMSHSTHPGFAVSLIFLILLIDVLNFIRKQSFLEMLSSERKTQADNRTPYRYGTLAGQARDHIFRIRLIESANFPVSTLQSSCVQPHPDLINSARLPHVFSTQVAKLRLPFRNALAPRGRTMNNSVFSIFCTRAQRGANVTVRNPSVRAAISP